MNKHLNDLTEVAARIIGESSRPLPTSTDHKVVKVPLVLVKQLQKLLEDTPIAEVSTEVFSKIAYALEREF